MPHKPKKSSKHKKSSSPPISPGPSVQTPNIPRTLPIIRVPPTPFAITCEPETGSRRTISYVKRTISAELARPYAKMTANAQFTENAFPMTKATLKDIDSFLKITPLYDNKTKRWKETPKNVKKEAALYAPLVKIMNEVFEHFKVTERQALNTSKFKVRHEEEDTKEEIWSSPDIMILGKGGTGFPDNWFHVKRPTYEFCVAPIEVKLSSNCNAEERIKQVGVYVRQCLAEQLGRVYVCTALITEKHMTLYHYDRCGVVVSTNIDIHQDARTFVQWILGIAASDRQIGFHLCIQWSIRQSYIKFTDDGNSFEYNIVEKPVYQRYTICGRATKCFRVRDMANGGMYIAKIVWQSVAREGSEQNILRRARGLKGVGQMVVCKVFDKVSDYRCISLPDEFPDRQLVLMIFEEYGSSIVEFSSYEDLLLAYKDAIAGHEQLLKNKIYHRDVHPDNIVFGTSMKDEGNRGLIIDLGMGVSIVQTQSQKHDLRSGLHAFRSIKSLTFPKLATDYLDDLESFFYILLWICIAYKEAKIPHDELPDLLQDWSHDDPRKAGLLKHGHMSWYEQMVEPLISPAFGEPFKVLLRELKDFVWRRYPSGIFDEEKMPKTVGELLKAAEGDYKIFLDAIDSALNSIGLGALRASTEDSIQQDKGWDAGAVLEASVIQHQVEDEALEYRGQKRQYDGYSSIEGSPEFKLKQARLDEDFANGPPRSSPCPQDSPTQVAMLIGSLLPGPTQLGRPSQLGQSAQGVPIPLRRSTRRTQLENNQKLR
ncbi:hypothetical protein AX16_006359 [Volvariella volvacea WC 439]|nr:hypothetical protein AX16_006359 [Volvariella volvacea WC 439]